MAIVLLTDEAKAVLRRLHRKELEPIDRALAVLTDHPLAYQSAEIRKRPDVRRAVAGQYLLYYGYDPEPDEVTVYYIRHGKQRRLGPSAFP